MSEHEVHLTEPQTDDEWRELATTQARMRIAANRRQRREARERQERRRRERDRESAKRQPCSLCGKVGREKRAGTRLCQFQCAELGEVSAWLVEHGVDAMESDALARALYEDYLRVERY